MIEAASFASYRLSGRVAVVTGAAGLLGPQHAAALVEAGASVVLTDINEPALTAAAARLDVEFGTGRVVPMPLDVTRPTEVAEGCRSVVAMLGRVDILVNNAAIDAKVTEADSGNTSRFERFTVDQWNAELNVGLTGAFLCSQAFGAWMAAHDGGVILNIASDLSVCSPDQRLYRVEGRPDDEQPVKPVTYSVIKTGLIGLTRYLATYWADRHVRVNALSPGGVFAGQPEPFVGRLTALIPAGRMATPDEYRAAVQFLCSDASRYMTGQNLVIDGGRSVW